MIVFHIHHVTSLPVGLERVMGIEPTYSAWKAAALPLSYTRTIHNLIFLMIKFKYIAVDKQILNQLCNKRLVSTRQS